MNWQPNESSRFIASFSVPRLRRNLSRSLSPDWEKSVFWKRWAEVCVLQGRQFVRGSDFLVELFGADELLCCGSASIFLRGACQVLPVPALP